MNKKTFEFISLFFLILTIILTGRFAQAQVLGQQEPPPRVGEYMRTPFMGDQSGETGPQFGEGMPPQGQKCPTPIDRQAAGSILQNYVNALNNPNLKLGPIRESANAFQAEIQTRDNKIIHSVAVDKNSGAVSVFAGR